MKKDLVWNGIERDEQGIGKVDFGCGVCIVWIILITFISIVRFAVQIISALITMRNKNGVLQEPSEKTPLLLTHKPKGNLMEEQPKVNKLQQSIYGVTPLQFLYTVWKLEFCLFCLIVLGLLLESWKSR